MYSGIENFIKKFTGAGGKVTAEEAKDIEAGKKMKEMLEEKCELGKEEEKKLDEGNMIREMAEKAMEEAKKSDSAINPEKKIESKK
jgi:hypothetical protein